jgi:archaellum component FlaF (FlaF/FlaG flagellin family)
MKRLLITLLVASGCVTVQAGNGERLAADSNQKVMHLTVPNVDMVLTYTGGDTVSVQIDNQGDESVQLRLLEDGITLLHDAIGQKPNVNRVYVISALPQGTYKIRLKKGTYVVEKELVKLTPAIIE